MGNISITGDLGSGKSTLARMICEKTGFEYFSTGKIQRMIAAERGIDTLQLNQACASDKSVDDLIDGYLRKMNTDGTTDTVLDSRLAWFFVNSSFKVYVTCLPYVAADRVFHDDKRTGEPGGEPEKVLENLLERQRMENERFKEFYNADCFNLDNFDLIVDSSLSSVDELSDLIIKKFNDFCKNRRKVTRWISPKLLVPTSTEIDEAGEFPSEERPVRIIKAGRMYYIAPDSADHSMTAAALKNGTGLIPVSVYDVTGAKANGWAGTYGFEFADKYLNNI